MAQIDNKYKLILHVQESFKPSFSFVATVLIYFASPSQDYSSLNYVDIVVDATLSLTNTPENIGLKPENPGTKVKP